MPIQTHVNSLKVFGAISAYTKKFGDTLRVLRKRFSPEEFEAQARALFGDTAFESAFDEGQKLSLDEALELAIRTLDEV